jgi:hypothetical protein
MAKSPAGMFSNQVIDNDMAAALEAIRKYEDGE